MISIEILRNVNIILIGSIVCLFMLTGCQERINNYYLSNSFEEQYASEEFKAISGNWEIIDYLGSSIPFNEEVLELDSYENKNIMIVEETKNRYLGQIIEIDKDNTISFGMIVEFGYYYYDYSDLTWLIRAPANVIENMTPPFLVIGVSLENFDDSFKIVHDNFGEMILEVKGQFFSLKKISEN